MKAKHRFAFAPGGGFALPGLQNPRWSKPVGPRKRSAAGQSWQRTRNRFRAGWRLRLTRPINPSLASPVGPRKRSAAGQSWQRTRNRFRAGWRLRLTRPTKPPLASPVGAAGQSVTQMFIRPAYRLGSVLHAQLAEHIVQMGTYGVFADE